MKKLFVCLILASLGVLEAAAENPTMIVKDGKPNAQIVVAAEKRLRMVNLAALELQYYIQKISGARLPIVTTPDAGLPVKIYVGKSNAADKLGVTDKDLKYGAYRMVSGPDRIVLLGEDKDFQHPMPWSNSRNDMKRATADWDMLIKDKTDSGWGFPFLAGFKAHWNPGDFDKLLSTRYGADAVSFWKGGKESIEGFWEYDGGGTLNAAYAFLRKLGVRWFMPGELGEVVPKMSTISVQPFNETVKPQFALRDWNYYNYSGFSFDDVIYARRLGMNSGIEKVGLTHGPHGLSIVIRGEKMKKLHPEYYALIGGKRDIEHRGQGTPNFMSDGLVQETVKYIRFMFDKYDMPLVDIWPPDGLRISQDEASKGKTASELVWGFVDRVAREIYKTHPGKLVSCGAYANYKDAPDSIEKFSPNVVVQISNCGRPLMEDKENWEKYQKFVDKWRSKIVPGNIMRLENSLYFLRGDAEGKLVYPVIHPRAMAKDLKFLKGISFGDTGEQSQAKQKWRGTGLNHINLYVQSQFLWNPDQDLDALLDDYYRQFYGPAAAQMKEAFTFAEDNLAYKDQSKTGGRSDPANVSIDKRVRLRDLLEKARQAAGDTVYGERIDFILSELVPKDKLIAQHRERAAALAEARAKAPVAIGVEGADLSKAAVYKLKDIRTGATPGVETSFQAGWDKDALILDILCKEPNMKKMQVSSDVHGGDYLAISLATPKHSYYHIEVNPDGALAEGRPGPNWKSLSDIKTERGADFWRVRLRIPVVGDEEANADPNHRVSGDKPTAKEPWYFNVGRCRNLEGGGAELQAFSPTLKNSWNVPDKFGRLEIK
jgi:hypothetical protein